MYIYSNQTTLNVIHLNNKNQKFMHYYYVVDVHLKLINYRAPRMMKCVCTIIFEDLSVVYP